MTAVADVAKAAEAAFDAYERALWPPTTDPNRQPYWRRWKDQSPDVQRIFTAVARAVLEAAGYDEAIALVEELRQWVHSECASITLYGPDDCKHCAYRSTCKLPKLAERIKAALARAGKEA